MLKFVSKSGDVVMTEKDNGELHILNEKLKQQIEIRVIEEEVDIDGK